MAIDNKKIIKNLIDDGFLKTQDDIYKLVVDPDHSGIYRDIYNNYASTDGDYYAYSNTPSKSEVLKAFKEAGIDATGYVKGLTDIDDQQFIHVCDPDLFDAIDFTKIKNIGLRAFYNTEFNPNAVLDLRNVINIDEDAFANAQGINKLILSTGTKFNGSAFSALKTQGNFELKIIGDGRLHIKDRDPLLISIWAPDSVSSTTLTCSFKFLVKNNKKLFWNVYNTFNLNILANGTSKEEISSWVEANNDKLKSILGLAKDRVIEFKII